MEIAQRRINWGANAVGFAIAVSVHALGFLAFVSSEPTAASVEDRVTGGLKVSIGETVAAATQSVASTASAAQAEGAPDGTADEVAPDQSFPVLVENNPESLVEQTEKPSHDLESVEQASLVEVAPHDPAVPVDVDTVETARVEFVPAETETAIQAVIDDVVARDVAPSSLAAIDPIVLQSAEPAAARPTNPVKVSPSLNPPVPVKKPLVRKTNEAPKERARQPEQKPSKTTSPSGAKHKDSPESARAEPTPSSQTGPETSKKQVRKGGKASQASSAAALQKAGAGAASAPGTADAGARKSYYASLQSWLERHKRYPRAARSRRREGTVQFRFMIDRSGHVLEQAIVASSGHRVLDRAVAALLERASPLPSMPPEVKGATLQLTTSVDFRLQ